MTTGQSYHDSVNGLKDGNSWSPSTYRSGTRAAAIYAIIAGGSCDIYWESDPDENGSYEVSIKVKSLSANSYFDDSEFMVDGREAQDCRIRIENTHGSEADFAAAGFEF